MFFQVSQDELCRLQHKVGLGNRDSSMDCQGAQEDPKRPEGPGDLNTATGVPPLALLPLPGPPGLPSGSSLGSLELPQTSLKSLGKRKGGIRSYKAPQGLVRPRDSCE